MNERQTIKALRDRDPRGVMAVYDRFAEGLYDYCWWLLRDHGAAREALHDTLLAAGVHADALRNPERLRPWLYALVRAECLRRSPATPRTDDDTAPDSGELRSLAWKATEAVPAVESDALQLHARHGIEIADLATVLGRSIGEVETLVEHARKRVGQALRAEMLAATGPTDCSGLTALLAESAGEEHYERVDRHARGCSVCSERVPRRVSVSRLMGLLPAAVPPQDLRQRVVDAYAEPRLLEYRLLAARRLQPLGREGFPSPGRRRRRSTGGTAALATVSGLVAAGLCAGAGLFIIRMAPVAEEARAAQRDGNMTYEQVSSRPSGTPVGEAGDSAIASRVSSGSGGYGGASGFTEGGPVGTAGSAGQTGPAYASGLDELTPFVPDFVPSPDDGEVAGWSPGPSAPGGKGDRGRPSPGQSSPGPGGPGGDSPGTSPSDSSSPSPSDSSPSDPSPTDSSSPSPSDSSSPTPSDPEPEPTPSESSPSESPTRSASPTSSESASPTSSASSSPTSSGSASPTSSETASPTSSPSDSASPSA